MRILLVTIAFLGGLDASVVDGDQAARLISAAHSDIKDVTFVYEGEIRFVDPSTSTGAAPTKTRVKRFQGNYSYRKDGAGLLEVYEHDTVGGTPLFYSKTAVLKGMMQSVSGNPDSREEPHVQTSGGRGRLVVVESPERLFQMERFNRLKGDALPGYEFLGWEDIDGHHCLKAKIKWDTSKSNTISSIYYIDFDRNAHPLRVDTLRGDKLQGRLDKVSLRQFALSENKTVWLPFSCEISTFEWEGLFHQQPVVHVNMAVVEGSCQINTGLTDAHFSLARGKPGMPPPALVRRAHAALGTVPAKPVRNDPVSVKKRLDAQLREADEKFRQLDASPKAEGVGAWAPMFQLALTLIGITVLGTAAYWFWKSR